MQYVNIVVCTFLLMEVKGYEDLSSVVDVNSLNVLPLEALLNIKKNVLGFSKNDTDETYTTVFAQIKESGPEALPFHATDKIKNKEGYYVQYIDEDSDKYEKKKSITKLFQLSVTSLAFLAFGGYLLFLIIASIKGKNYNYVSDANATQIMSAMINTEINKRRRKKKKPIRGDNFAYKEEGSFEKTHKSVNRIRQRVKRNILDQQARVDEMYLILVNLCEGYRKISGLYNV